MITFKHYILFSVFIITQKNFRHILNTVIFICFQDILLLKLSIKGTPSCTCTKKTNNGRIYCSAHNIQDNDD